MSNNLPYGHRYSAPTVRRTGDTPQVEWSTELAYDIQPYRPAVLLYREIADEVAKKVLDSRYRFV